MQHNKVGWFLFPTCLLVAMTSPVMATDFTRDYEKLLHESQSYQHQFRSRTQKICAEIRADCERASLASGQTISLPVPVQLHIRNGYRIEKAEVKLPANTPFTLQGTRKGYYKISTPDGKKFLIAHGDVASNYQSDCQARYDQCIAGKQ